MSGDFVAGAAISPCPVRVMDTDHATSPSWTCTWLTGLDAGASQYVGPGRHLVGRAHTAEVRCDDPSLQPHHALLDVASDGSLTVTQLTGRAPVMLRDTEAAAFAKVARRTIVIELIPTHFLDTPVEPDDTEDPKRELADVLAAAGSLSEKEMELLELLLQGHSQSEVAALLSVSERTVRNHRDAMVHRLRRAALAAA